MKRIFILALLKVLALTLASYGQWYTYKPQGSVDGQGIYREAMSRCPEYMLRQISNTDKATQCHEATHAVNSEISQTAKQSYGGFYVGNGQCVILPEPRVAIGQVAQYVPQELRTGRFKLYMTGDRVGRSCLAILDEWTCYANDAQCTQELRLPPDGGLKFAQEFSSFADILVHAVQTHDPTYSALPKLKEFVAWQKQRVANLVNAQPDQSIGQHPSPQQSPQQYPQTSFVGYWAPPYRQYQLVDLAPEFRRRNIGGSCVHATTVMLLRWQGLHQQADQWWANYRGGESAGPHRRKMESMDLKYMMTTDADERLLKWAIATRRGAGVTWGGAHCVALVGEHSGQAVILDNNAIDRFKYQPWDQFMQEFRRCGAWAFVILNGEVPPPTPVG